MMRSLVFALCLLGASLAQEDMPDFSSMPGFGDKPCPNFRCSSGYTPVQKSRSKFVSKGCSKMGGGMMMMAGGGGGDEKYASCCDQWHACYQTCGASKKSCDDGFKTCSERVCGIDQECKKSADMNSMMLGMGGCGLYDQGQYAGCECTKKSNVEEKRSAAIRGFYKKWSPENVDKADSLAKKADSNGKMAALFRKLTAKYPKSIKVEIDDEMKLYQDMMNKAKEEKDNDEGGADSDEHDEL